MRSEFRLAPMSPLILGLTVTLLCLPVVLVIASWRSPAACVIVAVAVWLLLLYAGVWVCFRPARFRVTEDAVILAFPGRRKALSIADVTDCRTLTGQQFKSEYGRAMRVGAGGLWGGFGLLWTSEKGWVEFYVSRTDGFLLIERQEGKPLLITPDDPEAMAEVVRSKSGQL